MKKPKKINHKNQEKILEILENLYTGSISGLNFSSPFELMVATILSAQTNDNQVNKITAVLFKKYNTAAQFAKLSPQILEQDIKTCGLYRNKAKNIIASAQIIEKNHGGKIPQNRKELLNLPGVGRKTANVILSNAFNIPALAVDTHVFRVSARLGLASGVSPDKTERELTAIIPEEKWGAAHHWLIWHGRKICTARSPQCEDCPLAELCPEVN